MNTERFVIYMIDMSQNPPRNEDVFYVESRERAEKIISSLKSRPDKAYGISDREDNKKYKRKDA